MILTAYQISTHWRFWARLILTYWNEFACSKMLPTDTLNFNKVAGFQNLEEGEGFVWANYFTEEEVWFYLRKFKWDCWIMRKECLLWMTGWRSIQLIFRQNNKWDNSTFVYTFFVPWVCITSKKKNQFSNFLVLWRLSTLKNYWELQRTFVCLAHIYQPFQN